MPEAFSTAFNQHDAHQLIAVMTKRFVFFKEDLTWLKGRARFEKYYARLFKNQFKDLSYKVVGTQIRMLRPDTALVRHCWTVQGGQECRRVCAPSPIWCHDDGCRKTEGNLGRDLGVGSEHTRADCTPPGDHAGGRGNQVNGIRSRTDPGQPASLIARRTLESRVANAGAPSFA